MKYLITIIINLICGSLFSQDSIVSFLDIENKETNLENAIYIKIIFPKNNHYFLTKKHIKGFLIEQGECKSIEPLIKDGLFVYYDKDNQVFSKGRYIDNRLSGQWIFNHNQTIKVVDYTPIETFINSDLCNKNQYIPIIQSQKNQLYDELTNFIHNNISNLTKFDITDAKATFYINTNGKIFCPQLDIKNNNNDFKYELFRILSLFESKLKFDQINYVESIDLINHKLDLYESSKFAFTLVDENATFNGGDFESFRSYVNKNIKYPNNGAKNAIEGISLVQITINKKGLLKDIKMIKSLGNDFDVEISRVLNSVPRWSPAKQGGVVTEQQLVIPVEFKLK